MNDPLELVRLIIAGDATAVRDRLRANPELATTPLPLRASGTQEPFFKEVSHYMYGGDTPLHMAAVASARSIAELLVFNGADCRARNRRGAEPLHYASDGRRSDPEAQTRMIEYLISIGADPNAVDRSGVAPLHRAVRRRSYAAVRALLDGGADPRQPNKAGSMPIDLAMKTTGASGSGSPESHRQQAQIVRLLRERG